jgi:hypothetical protein
MDHVDRDVGPLLWRRPRASEECCDRGHDREGGLLSTPYERGDVSRLCNSALRVLRHRHRSEEEQNESHEYDLERCHRRALHALRKVLVPCQG